jgi:spore germination protein YaaH
LFRNKLAIAVVIIMIALAVIIITALVLNRDDRYIDLPGSRPSKPLVVVWEYSGIDNDLSSIGPMEPVHVVSPTWFEITDTGGTVSSTLDSDYLQWAKSRGYQIWGLVTNSFDPDVTAAILTDDQVVLEIVDDLIGLATEHNLDGINVDFENFHSDYKNHFTRFVAELASRCRDEDLVLSVDVSMYSTSEYWSRCYDRAGLAAEADYIMLMAYDEHWKASPVAGSVASLPWVEAGLQRVLTEVPAEKLLLGVPFYTRLWEIDDSSGEEVVLNSWSYSMPRAEDIIADYNADIFFDENARQHVAEYRKDGLLYRMWLEDAVSMRERLNLIEKYNLAGLAAWRRGLETPDIWDLIGEFTGSLGE